MEGHVLQRKVAYVWFASVSRAAGLLSFNNMHYLCQHHSAALTALILPQCVIPLPPAADSIR